MKLDKSDLIALIGLSILLSSVYYVFGLGVVFIVVGSLLFGVGLWRAK